MQFPPKTRVILDATTARSTGPGGALTVSLAVGLMFMLTFGVGMASQMALSNAISVNRQVVGSPAGLHGFSQMAVGAVCTSLAGLGRDPVLAAATNLVFAGACAQVAFWIALRQEGP